MKGASVNNKRDELTIWRQWVQQHYEAYEGEGVARSTVYKQYVEHCHGKKIKPMSAALLGSIINSVFRNLRMRRLGSRGKSEYHYWGIRLKSPLNGQGDSETQAQTVPVVKERADMGLRRWLMENYEAAEGVSLPRSAVYDQFLWHCHEHNMQPVSSVALGKIINSVFTGLITRRLGTRGNSEYHYWGIKLKKESPLNRLLDNSEACPIETEDNLEGCPIETEDDLEGCPIETEYNLEGCPIETEDDLEGCPIETEDNLEGYPIETEANLEGCPIKTEDNSEGCPIETKDNSEACPVETEDNSKPCPTKMEKNPRKRCAPHKIPGSGKKARSRK